MIPTVEQCFRLMDQYDMLDHIKAHSLMVTKAAKLIARCLKDKGRRLSVRVVLAGALMHDIGKTRSFETEEDHAELGERICLENQLHEIAPIVAEHVTLKHYPVLGICTEKEVVYYADKRVNHDKFVGLEERLRYIVSRYGMEQEELRLRIRQNFEVCKTVESNLFRWLDFLPDALGWLAEREDLGLNSEKIRDFLGSAWGSIPGPGLLDRQQAPQSEIR